MNFTMVHTNLNVLELNRSLDFYKKALGLTEQRRVAPEDGSFVLVFLGDGRSSCQLELSCLADRSEPYDLGDNETHIAFVVDDYIAAHRLHSEMNCICFENEKMGIYFIEDPDGYWLEILPAKRS